MDQIFGYIENIVFADEQKGFTVAKLKEPKKRELTCIVGVMPGVQPGESLKCEGAWKQHPQHGLQFEVQNFACQAPSDLVGIQKYLESGMIKGIGPVYAERIVKHYGLKTLEIIDRDPGLLEDVPGLGKKRIEKIRTCWQEQRQIRDVMIFLRSHQISPSLAQKIFRTYGDRSISMVKNNPYCMARDIIGIGFLTADRIGQAMGIALDSPLRIDAGVTHKLWEFSNEGHVCYPKEELIYSCTEMLGVHEAAVQERLYFLTRDGEIVEENDLVWVKPLFLAEVGIAREIGRLVSCPGSLRQVDAEKATDWVEKTLNITFAPEQKQAVSEAVNSKVYLITGGPGTGKSTITKGILTILSKLTQKILLAAPTGRAAKRMSEITGYKAATIHSMLEMDFQKGGFKRGKDNPLECDLLIVDEASMIDTLLMHNLLKAVPNHAKLLIIGDVDQLPSVGPGNVLRDVIDSSCISVCRLKKIFRQAAGSRIIVNAHKINAGEFPDLSSSHESDFFFLQNESPEEVLNCIVDLVTKRLPTTYKLHRFDDIQVLAPMKKGLIGIENLNHVLQNALNPNLHPLSHMGRNLHLGDKVMQIRNNYQKEVYNGDIGRIISIDLTDRVVEVLFEDRKVLYEFTELDELLHAYAVSIHKYQGSECPCIVMPVHTSHFKMLQRNLLYTGVTRGKKLVVLVGTSKALMMGIKNNQVTQRNTSLKMKIATLLPSLERDK